MNLWLAGLVLVALVHLLLTVLLFTRWGPTPSLGPSAEEDTTLPGIEQPATHGDGRVHCPECGAANDPHYQYCRECAVRLPVAADGAQGPEGPPSGETG
ncbi:MAG: hypothetical protein ABEI31_07180 [Halodesulfurarchaeum sp.]